MITPVPLSSFDIANSYGHALEILERAQLATLNITAVRDKVSSVKHYLKGQAETAIEEMLR